MGRLAVGVLLLAFARCAKPPPVAPTKAPDPSPMAVERLLPLKNNTVFAYDTRSDPSGQTGMLVLEVQRTRSGTAELRVAGRIQRLEIDATGIRHVSGGWLLKQPPVLSEHYPGDFGTVEVTSLAREVNVPAGHFTDCVETVESASAAEFSKRTSTVFCPNVGIVSRKTEVVSDQGAGSESMALRSFGPRFEDFR